MTKRPSFIINHWFKMILSASILLMILVVFLFFPKNITRLGLFAVLFISDYYIWRVYRNWFFSQPWILQKILGSLYWLPSAFVLMSMIRVLFIGYVAFLNPYIYLFSGIVMLTFIVKFIFAMFLLFADFVRYLMLYIRRHRTSDKTSIVISKRNKYIVWSGMGSSLLFMILFLWGGFVDNNTIHVNKVEIDSKMLPASFDGLKIVQISDIHFVSWVNKESFSVVLDLINKQEPDVVMFTGDLVTFRTSEAIPFIPFMKKIKAKYGVYAILGNHDYGDYLNWETPQAKEANMTQLYDVFKKANWKLLCNQHDYIVNSNHDSIAIIGVENWSNNPRFKSKGDIVKAVGEITNSKYRILLTHDPSHWEDLLSKEIDFDLTLSGHTHGMQFAIINDVMNFSPISIIQKYWAGLHYEKINNRDCYLYVNTGLGTVSYPSRYGVPPEVTVIRIHHSSK